MTYTSVTRLTCWAAVSCSFSASWRDAVRARAAHCRPGARAPGLPTSTAGVGNNGSVDAKVCAAITTDVAAITKNVSNPATYPGQCAFNGGATTVTFFLDDPQHTYVTGGGTAISGIGDSAHWRIDGGVPSLDAWKGSVSCTFQPDSDVTDDTFRDPAGTPPARLRSRAGRSRAKISPRAVVFAAAVAGYAPQMAEACDVPDIVDDVAVVAGFAGRGRAGVGRCRGWRAAR